MINHAINAKKFYHFEDSDEFCEPEVVEVVAERMRQTVDLNDADTAQLETIVALEQLRFEYATRGMPVSELKHQIQTLRSSLITLHGREPFDNGNIDKRFYKLLNEEYGFVTK